MTNRDRLREVAEAWTGKPVLVVGDVMLDRYLWGRVARISPEAPVPVVEVEEETHRLGGAANVANNVRALGAEPHLVSVVGADADAGLLRDALVRAELSVSGLAEDPARPTTVKTRIIAQSHHMVRYDRESREELGAGPEAAVRRLITERLDGAAAAIISDYGKGVITASLLEAVLRAARDRGVPVCVDPKDTHFFSYRGVAVVTPNQHEAAEVLGYKLRDDAAVTRAGRELLERLRADAVLITRGAQGMSLFESGDRRTDLAAEARQVFDVTGAGDTVVATYAAALAGGAAPHEAALLANRAAGVVVGQVGTAVPDVESLFDRGGR